MLPSMLLSGFVFPIANMPKPLQVISSVIPARYFIDALRGVLLRGNGIAELWHDALALALFSALMVLAQVQRKDKSHRPKIEARAYRCSECRGWHLTSRK